MLSFIIAATVMTLIAMAIVLFPLWRVSTNPPISNETSNLTVLRNRRAEIEDEFNRGAINSAEYGDAVQELSVQVIDDIPSAKSGDVPVKNTRPVLLMIALALLLPTIAALLYTRLGALPAVQTLVETAPTQSPTLSDKQILAMVDSLAKKMEQSPADPKGWALLARSQAALGRYAEAAKAYGHLMTLVQPRAELAQHYADYADVLAVMQQGKFDGKPSEMIQKALSIDANNVKALALAGSVEMQRKDGKAALAYWQRLQKLLPAGSQEANEVTNIIAEIKGQPATPLLAAGVAQASTQTPASATDSKTSIQGIATLDPALRSKLSPTDSLFILARAKDGPKMPLAVMRISASELPKTFELSDSMAMAPGMNLSAFKEVVIEARVSKSGNAALASGDLSGVSSVVSPGARNVNVVISSVAP